MFCFTGTSHLAQLRNRWIRQAVSDTTWDLRRKHWKVYVNFCREYSFPVLPCSVSQAAGYISLLGLFMKHSSVLTYYQAVLFMHKLSGCEAPPLNLPLLRSILTGILNKDNGGSVKKEPFTPELLLRVYKVVKLCVHEELLTWIGLLLMFRSLLRVSHIVISPHTLRRCDVKFLSWGVMILVKSSKTKRQFIPSFEIPICSGKIKELCPVCWLKLLFAQYPRNSDAYLFSTNSSQELSYNSFRRIFKVFCKRANIFGNFASHSLRRGGATFMSKIGLPVSEIKDRGLWSSNIVFDYIQPSVEHRRDVDTIFSSFL